MEKKKLKAVSREPKINGRNLRRKGVIPAVIYNHGKADAIQVSAVDAGFLFAHGVSESTLIDLELNGKTETVFIKDYQKHPVNDEVIHLDFYRITANEKLRTHINIHLLGRPQGVKEGGILETFLTGVEYETFAQHLTPSLDIDISHLQIGDSIHVKDIALPPDSRILMDPNTVVCHVAQAVKEEVAPVADPAAATAAAAPAAETKKA